MNCPFTGHKPRWARRKDARPQELAAAALDLFVERGYAATRLDDVAARAGVSKGTLYLYFTNKEDLFKAVVRENVLPIIADSEQMVAGFQGNSLDMLKQFAFDWWTKFGESNLSGIPKLMMAEAANFPELAKYYHDEVIARVVQLITQIIERGIAAGEMRPVNIEYTTHVLMAPMLMLMLWKHSFLVCHPEPIDAKAYLETFTDMVLKGLEPR